MKTTPVILVFISVLLTLAFSDSDVEKHRRTIVSFIKANNQRKAELPEKRRWNGKMYSKLRKDESPPPTNNQLAPPQYDATPSPGATTPAAGAPAAPAPAAPGTPPSGPAASPGGPSAAPGSPPPVQTPYAQNPYAQQQRYPSPYQQQQPLGIQPYGVQPYRQPQFGQQPYRHQPFPQQPLGQQPYAMPSLPGPKGKTPAPAGMLPPPPQQGRGDSGCGTATVCGSFSISKEDPSSVLSPPAVPVMQPMMQQPCMPPMQAGCGGMMPQPPPMCPSICTKKCMVTCPKTCCPKSAIPGSQGDVKDSKSNEPSIENKTCPAICAVYCAHECPHNCCGPGGARRSYIARPRLVHASQLSPPALLQLEREAGDLKRH